ncbi:MAG TPA: nickel pincer cofactor biosynthesis protein LarC [Terrimicrobium sp.]
MRVLYLDCFSGISGDMAVGTLRDLGVEESVFLSAIAALGLGEEIHAHFERGVRQRIAGWKFETLARTGHVHDNHGRSFREIRALIEESRLSDFIKVRSISVFQRIAAAEGKIHGIPAEEVAFHEVGAYDSIGDIVAACAGIEALKVERVLASSLVDGVGWIDCAHGRLPVPSPATLEILSGISIRQIEDPHELITPTGAALLAEFSSSFGPFSEMQIEKIGYGLGTRDDGPRPNVLRALLGECKDTSQAEVDEIVQIETNLDDLSPELAGAAMERLLAAGALDVFFTPAQMKKNRPGFVLTVLCTEDRSLDLTRILLTETTSFGVRMHRAQRLKLRREFQERETPYGPVRIKLGFLGDELVQAVPEYESCREVAERASVSVKDVHVAAWIGTPPKPEGSNPG